MNDKMTEMDRRTFMKTTLAVGAGVGLAAQMKDVVWGESIPHSDLTDLPLFQLSKMIRSGEVNSKKLVELCTSNESESLTDQTV